MAVEDAVEDQVGERQRRRHPQEHGLDHGHERLVVGVPAVVEDPRLVRHVEDRRDPVVDERGPQPVVVGMRERATVDRRRARSSPSRTPLALSSASCPSSQRGSRSVRWATGCSRPPVSPATTAAPAVPRGHVGGERGQVGVERALPEQTRSSGSTRLRRDRRGRARRPGPTGPSTRAAASRRSRSRRGSPRRCRSRWSPQDWTSPGRCTSASPRRLSRHVSQV